MDNTNWMTLGVGRASKTKLSSRLPSLFRRKKPAARLRCPRNSQIPSTDQHFAIRQRLYGCYPDALEFGRLETQIEILVTVQARELMATGTRHAGEASADVVLHAGWIVAGPFDHHYGVIDSDVVVFGLARVGDHGEVG